MDFDRLNIDEVSKISELIKLLGTPASPDDLIKLINVCEGAATLYHKELERARTHSRNHGE